MAQDDNKSKSPQSDLLRMTADVVSAYLGNNTLPVSQVSDVIKSVYGSLSALSGEGGGAHGEGLKPAVPIRKSIAPDYVVCLEDGKRLKMLKRHLRTTYGLTPDEYRAKWGLPPDYPMVAPNYAAQRSAFAKKIGLGRKPGRRRKSRG
ncbi:MAG: Ros/MucR family transcriptional regulator [Alphaproteobacteria bacterium]